uniref:Zinc finger protein NUTCRACKER-like n=1 Tax=Rhizophora mucronata TaxID=61149 RepID=A0A2P2J5F6_RHIMU
MTHLNTGELGPSYLGTHLATWQNDDRLTRDFLGLTADGHGTINNENGNGATGTSVNDSMSVRKMLTYTGGLRFQHYNERDHSLWKPRGVEHAQPSASETCGDCYN